MAIAHDREHTSCITNREGNSCIFTYIKTSFTPNITEACSLDILIQLTLAQIWIHSCQAEAAKNTTCPYKKVKYI